METKTYPSRKIKKSFVKFRNSSYKADVSPSSCSNKYYFLSVIVLIKFKRYLLHMDDLFFCPFSYIYSLRYFPPPSPIYLSSPLFSHHSIYLPPSLSSSPSRSLVWSLILKKCLDKTLLIFNVPSVKCSCKKYDNIVLRTRTTFNKVLLFCCRYVLTFYIIYMIIIYYLMYY